MIARTREPAFSTRKRGLGRAAPTFAIIVLLVAGAIGFVSLNPAWTSTGRTPASAELSSKGIQLAASITGTTIVVGHGLNVSVSIFNTLPRVNTVRPSADWRFQGVPMALWPPCYFGLPAEMVILKGYYNLQDLRSVANVPFSYVCAEAVSVDHVIFQPNSGLVSLTGIYDVTNSNQTLGPFHMSLNFTTGGYWDLRSLSRELNPPILGDRQNSPTYIPFVQGVYTVAVADEWGQAVVLHFTVLSDVNSPLYLTASAICTGPGGYLPCWGGEAYIFNCADAAATPQGCSQQVTGTLAPRPSYFIDVRYPYYNQTEPLGANCLWTVGTIAPEQGYAHCTSTNSTSFFVSIQAPPHL
jgi:hypothetical protein